MSPLPVAACAGRRGPRRCGWIFPGGEDGVDAVDDGVREVLKVGAVEVVRAGYEVIDKDF